MNEVYSNLGQQTITITYADVLAQVSQQLTSQLLVIGVFVTLCALWHMFAHQDTKWRITITNGLDMCMFMAGTYLIALYAITYWGFKPW